MESVRLVRQIRRVPPLGLYVRIKWDLVSYVSYQSFYASPSFPMEINTPSVSPMTFRVIGRAGEGATAMILSTDVTLYPLCGFFRRPKYSYKIWLFSPTMLLKPSETPQGSIINQKGGKS